ncbi:MAG: hypothetical protein HY856_11660 [Burkholderiales bacterium]|nr:hypothetical protein [Burkholderiales bacterium]
MTHLRTPVLGRLALAAGTATTLAALATALTAPPAAAAPATAWEGARTPAQRLQAAQAHAARQRAALPRALAETDSTPPVLERFSVAGDVDARSPIPSATLRLAMSDDLSGLQTWIVTLVGPSGQMVQRVEGVATGQRRLAGGVSVGGTPVAVVPFTAYTEPGTWTVESLFVSDNAYNMRIYDREALAALGRTSFTVRNDGGHDKEAPQMVRGVLQTPRVSLSATPPGTWPGRLPYLAAAIHTTDTGNGVVAGASSAILTFCLPDRYGDCVDRFELPGQVAELGRATNVIRVGAEARADLTPGRYVLYSVYIEDAARNFRYMMAGDTDFSAYFPNPTLVITP